MRNIAWGIVIASSMAVSVSAQAQGQQPAQGQPPSPEQPATQGDQAAPRTQQPAITQQMTKTTISGCIQNAPPAAPSAAGAPSMPGAAKFELANAKVVTTG